MSGSQVDVVGNLAAMHVAEEASFLTGGTDCRCYPIFETVEHSPKRAELEYKPLRTRPNDYQAPVKGLQENSGKFDHYFQAPGTALASGTTVPNNTNPLSILMRCALGGESVAAGTLLAAGGTAGGGSAASGQGVRFPAGQIVLITDPANGLVPRRILSRATDALTWWPNLSGSPATSAPVINCYTWYPAWTTPRYLKAVYAYLSAAHQYEYRGGIGTVDVDFTLNELAKLSFAWQWAKCTGPSAQSYSTATAADPNAPPQANTDLKVLLQTPATTTSTVYAIDSIKISMNVGWDYIKALSGGTQGKRGATRTKNLEQPTATIEIVTPADVDLDATLYAGRTAQSLMVWNAYDPSGGGRRVVGVDAPLVIPVGKPEPIVVDNLAKTKLTLKTQLDTSCTGTLDNTELAQAGIRFFAG